MKYLFFFPFVFYSWVYAQDTSHLYEWHVKYKAKDNTVIGLWPSRDTWKDTARLKEIKYLYGFTHIIIYPDNSVFPIARSVFNSNMMLAFYEGWFDKENKYSGLWGYYIDEPIRYNTDSSYLKKISQWVHSKNPGSLFFSGDYKRTDYLKQISDNYTDGIMYTSYFNWNKFLGWWLPGSEDQRDSWRDMKRIFKDKFYMTWVNCHLDSNEFDLLFKEAKTLKISGIWLYCDYPNSSTHELELFCEAMVRQGYMIKSYGWIKKKLLNGKITDINYDP